MLNIISMRGKPIVQQVREYFHQSTNKLIQMQVSKKYSFRKWEIYHLKMFWLFRRIRLTIGVQAYQGIAISV